MSLPGKILLSPLSALYGAVTGVRLSLYRAGALKVYSLGAPVISVGNITAGGTGKTPLVERVARSLAEEGRRPCILTRGYARADSGKRVVVSDGERVLADAQEGGDEPVMLAGKLSGVASVISDKDRVAAASWARENLKSDAFILDDGFQHLRVARDLDIVTVDATDPWGGGSLLPRGLLRESPEGLARADCVVVTRCDQAENLGASLEEIKVLSGGKPILLSRTRAKCIRDLRGAGEAVTAVEEVAQPVGAFCALGNPRAFFAQVRAEGFTAAYTRSFADHHLYSQRDVEALEDEARSKGARSLITTAKDAVKLRSLNFQLPCFVLEIDIAFDDEHGFSELIRDAIRSVLTA